MPRNISRRGFVQTAALLAVGATLAGAPVGAVSLRGRIKKALGYGMIKEKLSVLDKFKLLKDLGYHGVEVSIRDKVAREDFLKAIETTGIPVHSVVNGSTEKLNNAIDLAKYLGATSVLVVAGRVNDKVPYAKNYETTQAQIRKAIPHAEKNEVPLLIENVWNNFLLSPLEMARYVDELDSPWAGAYFDVGNVARFGWPAHWIPVLGKRIRKLHIKAYSRKKQMDEGPWKGFQVKMGDDEIDWAAVRKELVEIDYRGWVTAEVSGGNRERLADISARMDKVLDL
jgi:L-ribulose-5-phosphate 3-epimerase